MLPQVLTNAIGEGTITRIYHGCDNCCRCGCKGKYYTREDRGFHRVYTEAIKKAREVLCETDNVSYVNIPYEKNRAYTIYIG